MCLAKLGEKRPTAAASASVVILWQWHLLCSSTNHCGNDTAPAHHTLPPPITPRPCHVAPASHKAPPVVLLLHSPPTNIAFCVPYTLQYLLYLTLCCTQTLKCVGRPLSTNTTPILLSQIFIATPDGAGGYSIPDEPLAWSSPGATLGVKFDWAGNLYIANAPLGLLQVSQHCSKGSLSSWVKPWQPFYLAAGACHQLDGMLRG